MSSVFSHFTTIKDSWTICPYPESGQGTFLVYFPGKVWTQKHTRPTFRLQTGWHFKKFNSNLKINFGSSYKDKKSKQLKNLKCSNFDVPKRKSNLKWKMIDRGEIISNWTFKKFLFTVFQIESVLSISRFWYEMNFLWKLNNSRSVICL